MPMHVLRVRALEARAEGLLEAARLVAGQGRQGDRERETEEPGAEAGPDLRELPRELHLHPPTPGEFQAAPV